MAPSTPFFDEWNQRMSANVSLRDSLDTNWQFSEYIVANEHGEPSNKDDLQSLVDAINFHTNRHIPTIYKDNHDIPNIFVKKVVADVKKSIEMRDIAENYIINLVKEAWREWTSPYSASSPYQRRTILMDPVHPLMDWRACIDIDEHGEVHSKDDYKLFFKATKFHTRRYIPILYKDTRDLPENFLLKVISALQEIFYLRYVDEYCIASLVKEAWRGHKNELRRKYIKDKDPAIVKARSPSPFVTNEDWSQFVDMSTSSEYKALCAKNASNMWRKKETNTHGHYLAGTYSETGETEMDDISHGKTKKRKSMHSDEIIANAHEIVSSDLELSRTGTKEAVSEPAAHIGIKFNHASPQLDGPSMQPHLTHQQAI